MSESENLPFVYGGLDPELSDFETSRVLIWPVPFEKTVSYGHGTKDGPRVIIDASRNMELYDEEIGGETCSIGIHTLPAIDAEREPPEMMAALEEEASRWISTGKLLCMLGGEHSITPPVVRAHAKAYPALSVLQIDAHADLRDSYDGTRFSHACAMRRVLETCPAVQVGIRSLSSAEAGVNLQDIFFAKDIRNQPDWIDSVIHRLRQNVYLTIDIDGLDPSIAPDTGTPEPGGLGWYQVLDLIREVAVQRRIAGMDLVEVSGSGSSRITAFTASKLIYKTLGYVLRGAITCIPESRFPRH